MRVKRETENASVELNISKEDREHLLNEINKNIETCKAASGDGESQSLTAVSDLKSKIDKQKKGGSVNLSASELTDLFWMFMANTQEYNKQCEKQEGIIEIYRKLSQGNDTIIEQKDKMAAAYEEQHQENEELIKGLKQLLSLNKHTLELVQEAVKQAVEYIDRGEVGKGKAFLENVSSIVENNMR